MICIIYYYFLNTMQLTGILTKALSLRELISGALLENEWPGYPRIETNVGGSPRNFVSGSHVDKQHIMTNSNRRPLVIWHGLGDSYNSSAMEDVISVINQRYPDMYIHAVYMDEDQVKDQEKSLLGDANEEVEYACEQLSIIPELYNGFDAIGFSQGGLLMRALVQRCANITVHNLVTFGSPHMGIMELPKCENPSDWLCKKKNELLKKQVWHDNIQKSIIPAQYFRDPNDYDNYVAHSHFLADVNKESINHAKQSYGKNLNKLNKFIMVVFTEDTTVVPKESAGFNDWDPVSDTTIPFNETSLYKNDWVGLKALNEDGKVKFLQIEAAHMVISDTFLIDIANDYLGGVV